MNRRPVLTYALLAIYVSVGIVVGWVHVYVRSPTSADVVVVGQLGNKSYSGAELIVSEDFRLGKRDKSFEDKFSFGFIKETSQSEWTPGFAIEKGKSVSRAETIKDPTVQGHFFECFESSDSGAGAVAAFVGRTICSSQGRQFSGVEIVELVAIAWANDLTSGISDCKNEGSGYHFGAVTFAECSVWS
jgi:hypothetical protein